MQNNITICLRCSRCKYVLIKQTDNNHYSLAAANDPHVHKQTKRWLVSMVCHHSPNVRRVLPGLYFSTVSSPLLPSNPPMAYISPLRTATPSVLLLDSIGSPCDLSQCPNQASQQSCGSNNDSNNNNNNDSNSLSFTYRTLEVPFQILPQHTRSY